MTDIKYNTEEIEEVKRYVKKTIVDYHLHCDGCNEEILDGKAYYEVNIYGANYDVPSEEKCLCTECARKLGDYFIENNYYDMDISKKIFCLEDHLGASHKYDGGIDDIALKLKFNKNRNDFQIHSREGD